MIDLIYFVFWQVGLSNAVQVKYVSLLDYIQCVVIINTEPSKSQLKLVKDFLLRLQATKLGVPESYDELITADN